MHGAPGALTGGTAHVFAEPGGTGGAAVSPHPAPAVVEEVWAAERARPTERVGALVQEAVRAGRGDAEGGDAGAPVQPCLERGPTLVRGVRHGVGGGEAERASGDATARRFIRERRSPLGRSRGSVGALARATFRECSSSGPARARSPKRGTPVPRGTRGRTRHRRTRERRTRDRPTRNRACSPAPPSCPKTRRAPRRSPPPRPSCASETVRRSAARSPRRQSGKTGRSPSRSREPRPRGTSRPSTPTPIRW